MKRFCVNLLVFVAVCSVLAHETEARSGRKCRGDCFKRRRHARRGRSQKASDSMLESPEPAALVLPQNFNPDTAALKLSDPKMLKLLEEFVNERPHLLRKDSGFQLPQKKYPTNHYTEAVVEASSKDLEGGNALGAIQVIGKFGYHSRHQQVHGRVFHVQDVGPSGSNFGCSSDITNKEAIRAYGGPWIALVSRGKCTFLVKIKLAERFNASAVIVYDTKSQGDVEVMRTIGSKIPSLMINASAGHVLSNMADGNSTTYANISVGAINIQTSGEVAPVETNDFKEAIVDFQSKHSATESVSLHKAMGLFGVHSPQKAVSAKVIHVTDPESEDSHYGCSGSISNPVRDLQNEWVALIANGKCNPLAKIMLAEKYDARAVIIYHTEFQEEKKPINAFGANITALTIDTNDGRKVVELMKQGMEVYLDISTNSIPRTQESGRGGANSIHSSSIILFCLTCLVLLV